MLLFCTKDRTYFCDKMIRRIELRLIVVMCITIILQTTVVQSGNKTYVEDLYKHLFDNYKREILPSLSQTNYVSLMLNLFSVKEFDEITGTLSTVGGLDVSWHDGRLAWNPQDFGNVSELSVPSSYVWYPDLFFLNPAEKMTAIGEESFRTRLHYTGNTYRALGSVWKTTCTADMTRFPFDQHVCSMVFNTGGYTPEEVQLTNNGSMVSTAFYTENVLWKLTKTTIQPQMRFGIKGILSVDLHLERSSRYIMLNIVGPILLICILSPFVFLLPPESGERISYTVTMFLSLAVFMTLLNDQMPRSSLSLPRFSYFLFMALLYSALQCVISILTLGLHMRQDSARVPSWMHTLLSLLTLQCCCRACGKAKRLGKTKRIHVKQKSTELDEEVTNVERNWKYVAAELDKIAFVYSMVFIVLNVMLLVAFWYGAISFPLALDVCTMFSTINTFRLPLILSELTNGQRNNQNINIVLKFSTGGF